MGPSPARPSRQPRDLWPGRGVGAAVALLLRARRPGRRPWDASEAPRDRISPVERRAVPRADHERGRRDRGARCPLRRGAACASGRASGVAARDPRDPRGGGPAPRPKIIVVTIAMLVFISFCRASAIVLCDMASTVYYIGGIVEQAIGKAAPWYIGAVMLFAYAVRGVYIESCAMFVRGGVYRVVKEAMGGTLAKLSVSALMFDYVLTGPISGVSAGQYIVGLTNELLHLLHLPA